MYNLIWAILFTILSTGVFAQSADGFLSVPQNYRTMTTLPVEYFTKKSQGDHNYAYANYKVGYTEVQTFVHEDKIGIAIRYGNGWKVWDIFSGNTDKYDVKLGKATISNNGRYLVINWIYGDHESVVKQYRKGIQIWCLSSYTCIFNRLTYSSVYYIEEGENFYYAKKVVDCECTQNAYVQNGNLIIEEADCRDHPRKAAEEEIVNSNCMAAAPAGTYRYSGGTWEPVDAQTQASN